MKKPLCCFLFLLLYWIGFLAGILSSGWLYPVSSAETTETVETTQTAETTQTVETLEIVKTGEKQTKNSARSQSLEETRKPYPGAVWGKRIVWQYVLYFILTVAMLEIVKKPLPVLGFWLLYGVTSGIYARGLSRFYGRMGEYYGLTAVLIIPSILAVLTGIFWIKPGIEPGVSYFPYQKRIRDIFFALRIRILPSCFYAAALLICYVADYEIVKRIQWKLLLRMLRNVVN